MKVIHDCAFSNSENILCLGCNKGTVQQNFHLCHSFLAIVVRTYLCYPGSGEFTLCVS